MSEQDPLSAFRRFIEEVLDLSWMDKAIQPPVGMADWSRYHPALKDHEALQRDIRAVWNALHRERPGQTYWGFWLRPLQLETRAVLQEMIFKAVRKRFQPTPTDADLRAMIAYTMTLSWLILAALADKYAPPDDSGSSWSPTP